MSDESSKRPVSEISHLFLSNIRDLHGPGTPRPQRTPPGGQKPSPAVTATAVAASAHAARPAVDQDRTPTVDLTPDEYAQVLGPRSAQVPMSGNEPAPTDPVAPFLGDDRDGNTALAPVTALLAAHLSGRQLDRAREYARHLAASVGRVGLIDLDISEFRLYCFDPAVEPGMERESRPVALTGVCDPREIAEAIEELNVDVERWLVLLPNLLTPEARALVHDAEQWTLLCTCDHDGVVAAYRTLKMVCDARLTESAAGRNQTRLSLAVLDAAGDAEATRVQQKLASVCRQFLQWDVELETPVRYAAGVAEHPLMNCRVSRDKAQMAVAPHWQVVAEMLGRARRQEKPHIEAAAVATPQVPADVGAANGSSDDSNVQHGKQSVKRITFAEQSQPEESVQRSQAVTPEPGHATRAAHGVSQMNAPAPVVASISPAASTVPSAPVAPPSESPAATETTSMRIDPISLWPAAPAARAIDDVIDLPGDASDAAGILSAVLRRPEWGLAECPVTPPMCPSARLAVTRNRGLTLVAVATRGLSELRSIGLAYRWMTENQSLIAMALPQFALDTAKTPALRLLVDQTDISADLLRPILQAEHVQVRAYRALRWAGRTGLLLDAA